MSDARCGTGGDGSARPTKDDARDGTPPGRALAWGALGVALLVLAFPPFGLWPAGLLAPWPFGVAATRARSGARAFWLFTLLGVGVICGTTWWLSETHVFNLAVVTVVEAPLVGLLGWLAWRTLRTGAVFPALPVLWTAHEMVRMSWPETGYGWGLLGQALAASPLLVQVADLGGVLAVSFVGASAAAAVWAQLAGRPGRTGALAVVGLALLYGALRPGTLPEPEPGPLVATIQPGFPQELKDDGDAAPVRYRRCADLVAVIARDHPDVDLLVFPETMWPGGMLVDARRADTPPDPEGRVDATLAEEQRLLRDGPLGRLLDLFPAGGPHWLLGTPAWGLASPEDARPGGRPRMLNSAVLFSPTGDRLGRYDKHILIPGGETIPFRGTLPEAVRAWLDRMVRDLAGFLPDVIPGPGPVVLPVPLGPAGANLPVGVTICFENAYGDFNGALADQGAAFLLNLSNEGWFGTSPEFDHMELQSVLRAVETRRALFRSTNTGISCLVRPDGRRPEGDDRLEVGGVDRGVAGTFAARVPLHRGTTPYVLWGDLLGYLCLTGAAVLVWLRRASRVP